MDNGETELNWFKTGPNDGIFKEIIINSIKGKEFLDQNEYLSTFKEKLCTMESDTSFSSIHLQETGTNDR